MKINNEKNYQELIREKEVKKQSIMSEKQIELAEQYLVWYRRAYQDKQRLGLIEKWQETEKYWEGEFEYDDEDDPAPNTNITNSSV